MKNIPIATHQIAFLQAYLYEVFGFENQCKKSFENSEWYLKEKHNEEDVKLIFDYFRFKNINCDCDIINKIDLRDFSKSDTNYHH